MSRKMIITISFYMLMILSATLQISGQTAAVPLQDQSVNIQMMNKPLGMVFGYLMQRYQIAIGFEESILDRNHADYNFFTNLPSSLGQLRIDGVIEGESRDESIIAANQHLITVNVENGKLSDALDQIVGQMKHYKWEINDGVINIFPIEGRDERFRDLMETNIANFYMPRGKTVHDISLTILLLPEFGKWARKYSVKFHPFRRGAVYQLNDQYYQRTIQQSISLSNVNFRRLLNKIASIKGGGWILRSKMKTPSGDEHIDIDI